MFETDKRCAFGKAWVAVAILYPHGSISSPSDSEFRQMVHAPPDETIDGDDGADQRCRGYQQ